MFLSVTLPRDPERMPFVLFSAVLPRCIDARSTRDRRRVDARPGTLHQVVLRAMARLFPKHHECRRSVVFVFVGMQHSLVKRQRSYCILLLKHWADRYFFCFLVLSRGALPFDTRVSCLKLTEATSLRPRRCKIRRRALQSLQNPDINIGCVMLWVCNVSYSY